MAKILVVGGYEPEPEDLASRISNFAKLLGHEVVRQGHTLLNACSSQFDYDVAEGALKELQDIAPNAINQKLCSWVRKGSQPVHKFGRLLASEYEDWDPAKRVDETPEPIARADVIVLVAGNAGVNRAALWADAERKPILPVATFDGSAQRLFRRERPRVETTKFIGQVSQDEFDILNTITDDLEDLANQVISLAESIIVPKFAVVCMSYSPTDELNELFDSYKIVCEDYKYECLKVTELTAEERIVPEILDKIRRAGFILVDLTELKQNVFYEMGFAEGLEKHSIVTAREGTDLPFDVKDIPTLFWSVNQMSAFRKNLKERIRKIAATQGHLD